MLSDPGMTFVLSDGFGGRVSVGHNRSLRLLRFHKKQSNGSFYKYIYCNKIITRHQYHCWMMLFH